MAQTAVVAIGAIIGRTSPLDHPRLINGALALAVFFALHWLLARLRAFSRRAHRIGLRRARAERGGQDDHDPDARDAAEAGCRVGAGVGPRHRHSDASRGFMHGGVATADIVVVLAVAAAITAVFAPLTVRMYYRARRAAVRHTSDMDALPQLIASLTREVPDFPTAGVHFRDLTPLLADPHGFGSTTAALAEVADGADLVAGVDARGFLLAAAVANRLGTGVLAIRKGGKLPPPVHSVDYTLEYGTATLEIPADHIDLTGRTVIVIDDVLATGGTGAAAHQLLATAGAQVSAFAAVLELAALGGRRVLDPLPVHCLRVV